MSKTNADLAFMAGSEKDTPWLRPPRADPAPFLPF